MELESAIRSATGWKSGYNKNLPPDRAAKLYQNDYDCPLAKPVRGLASQLAPQGGRAEQTETEQRNCRAAIGDTRDTHRPDLEREVLVRSAPHAHT